MYLKLNSMFGTPLFHSLKLPYFRDGETKVKVKESHFLNSVLVLFVQLHLQQEHHMVISMIV